MNIKSTFSVIRIPKHFYDLMFEDLMKPHAFAFERVGFFSTNVMHLGADFIVVTVTGYHSVDDMDYINDPDVGAKINGNAIRKAMQRMIPSRMGCLHVHIHDHLGKPRASCTDLKSLPELSASFCNMNPEAASGYIIFSRNSFYSEISIGSEFMAFQINQMSIVGYPMSFVFPSAKITTLENSVYTRQSFLGQTSQELLSNVCIGVVGLGGGGSHIVQQLAYLGIIHYRVFDGDHIEETNHNRLVGGWFSDIQQKLKKTSIAHRLIRKINPKAQVNILSGTWQEFPNELKKCDIIIGCVDSFDQRSQLEAACRQALIPYIDIGMDVHKTATGHSIAGQIILSMPDMPCMRCMGFLTETKLSKEAEKYGAAGGNPQVIWPNGVLASSAIGVLIDLITEWTKSKNRIVYLSYDGDLGHLGDHPRLEHCPKRCNHHNIETTGSIIFKKL